MALSARAALLVTLLGACAPARSPAVPAIALQGTDGAAHELRTRGRAATVYVFFSAHCPCVAAHDERLGDLARRYGPRGVTFLAIDSEVEATAARDAAEARARGYPFPILLDPGGRAARALGAVYATYSVVVDARGEVRYRGGLDSDKNRLGRAPAMYLRDALDDVLADRAVRHDDEEALGCALQIR